jgi:glycosyltransferase involved in cell wall biosynthesis
MPTSSPKGQSLMADSLDNRTRVSAISPLYGLTYAIPSCCFNITENLDRSRFDAQCWFAGADLSVAGLSTVRLAMPRLLHRAYCKMRGPREMLRPLLEWRYLRELRPGTIAWVWPDMTTRFLRTLKRRGYVIALERINSNVKSARQLIDSKAAQMGFAPDHGITSRSIEQEELELEVADYVFVCSPFVEDSFLKAGVRPERLRRCTFGWDPRTFTVKPRGDHSSAKPVFLFVGTGCLRKGLPDLLEHWDRANLPARLRIVGPIAPAIATRYARVLSRPDVEAVGMKLSLVEEYTNAHVFVLPSIEEGSPLVTYLALASGIPSLVSYPGAGGIVHDDIEGFVRDPAHESSFQEALAQLATDARLRERLGRAAFAASEHYTWPRVAKKRGEIFAAMSPS